MADVFKQQGAFSWSELLTTDIEGAKKFYTELLGWTTEDFLSEEMSYTIVKAGGGAVGGIMSIPPQAEGMASHWGVYVTVDDVDATTKKAEELGGNILMQPTDIKDVGRFSVLQDPQGAVFCIITYVQRQGTA